MNPFYSLRSKSKSSRDGLLQPWEALWDYYTECTVKISFRLYRVIYESYS